MREPQQPHALGQRFFSCKIRETGFIRFLILPVMIPPVNSGFSAGIDWLLVTGLTTHHNRDTGRIHRGLHFCALRLCCEPMNLHKTSGFSLQGNEKLWLIAKCPGFIERRKIFAPLVVACAQPISKGAKAIFAIRVILKTTQLIFRFCFFSSIRFLIIQPCLHLQQ
jgi:hypothetical protein